MKSLCGLMLARRLMGMRRWMGVGLRVATWYSMARRRTARPWRCRERGDNDTWMKGDGGGWWVGAQQPWIYTVHALSSKGEEIPAEGIAIPSIDLCS